MKNKTILTYILILMSSIVSGQMNSKEIIKQLNQQFLNALVQKDSAALANILAEDFILINPAGQRRTKADNLASLHTPGQSVISINIDSEDVRLFSDELGSITVWTTNHILAGKENQTFKICYTDIYQKRNNKWKAVAAHVSLLQ